MGKWASGQADSRNGRATLFIQSVSVFVHNVHRTCISHRCAGRGVCLPSARCTRACLRPRGERQAAAAAARSCSLRRTLAPAANHHQQRAALAGKRLQVDPGLAGALSFLGSAEGTTHLRLAQPTRFRGASLPRPLPSPTRKMLLPYTYSSFAPLPPPLALHLHSCHRKRSLSPLPPFQSLFFPTFDSVEPLASRPLSLISSFSFLLVPGQHCFVCPSLANPGVWCALLNPAYQFPFYISSTAYRP